MNKKTILSIKQKVLKNSILYLFCIFFIVACVKEAPTEPVNAVELENIDSKQGVSDNYGVYKSDTGFAVNVPTTGDYHLHYTTNEGIFDLIFHIIDSALIIIRLDEGTEIHDATLAKIVIDNPPSQPILVNEDLILYYATGDNIPWESFSSELGSTPLTLIENGNTISSSVVIILEAEDLNPGIEMCTGEHTLTNSYNVFACEISEGFTVDSGGWYWIRMSIGFETPNGEAEAREAKPTISLPVWMDGISLSMVDTTIVEYNEPAGFWEVNAYYCTEELTTGEYVILGKSYWNSEFVDSSVCIFTVK